jgi:hypothetical protein
MKSSERDKNIRVLIVGVVAYTLLHAVMFIGGSESLLFNLRSYFWILLALDIITNLLTREKLISDITKAFPVLKSSSDTYDAEDDAGYRLIVPSANPEEELPLSNSNLNSKESGADKNPINMEIREKSRKKKKSKSKTNNQSGKREVTFSNPLTTENSYANKIPERDVPTIENLLEQKLMNGQLPGSKSTPLNQLNQLNQLTAESGFSDSDSDFTTDMDGDFSNFERGLSF